MNLNDFNALHREIYDEIYSKLERKDQVTLRFAPRGTAEQVLHADKLRRLFRSLLEPDNDALRLDDRSDHLERTVEKYVARVNERKLYRFLTVLIVAECPITPARAAVSRLVANDTWPVTGSKGKSISSLPVALEDLNVIFDQDRITADKFLGMQAWFCPVILRKNEEVRLGESDYRRLPYLEEHSIGKGSFGRVFSVKIAKGHFYNSVKKTANVEPLEIARKDYELSRDAVAERETMKKILASSTFKCPNILKSQGSLELGSTVYSLFMPKAICDLRAYMMAHHQARLNTIEERKDLVRCAIGLAGGLNFLHNEMKTPDMEDIVLYHMDLKPSNILIFEERDPADNRQMRKIWKLSDFGMSKIKIKSSGDVVPREKDVNRWFIQRSPREAPSASATRNARGDGTYLPPESTDSGRKMRASSDVWSLGCVLSVLFCYMDGGRDRVIKYAEERMMHYDAVGCDTFFVPRRRIRSAKLNPVVHKTHIQLIRSATRRSPCEGVAVKYALRYIEKLVLEVDQSKRSDAKQVKSMLESTFKAYQKAEENESRSPLSELSSVNSIPSQNGNSRDKSIDSWYLSDTEALKGCHISPDCSLIAYWTDRKISLYSIPPSQSTKGTVLEHKGEYTLEKQDCFWKTIRLTSKYLVASTTMSTFQCYLFDLTNLNHGGLPHPLPIELPHPAVSKLAISPDSCTLACVLNDREDARKPGSLYVASIKELIRTHFDQLQSSPSNPCREISSNLTQSTAVNYEWVDSLTRAAENITKLSFSTAENVYFVVLPELASYHTEHTISLAHVNVVSRDLHVLRLDSRGLDSTARLLTTFAPFHQKAAACTIVTRERQLHIHDMTAENPAILIQKEIKNYRVLKLMMAINDDKMYALARKSGNHRIMVLEMKVPGTQGDELCARELADLPDLSEDDEMTERLHENEGEKFITIAALVGKGRRAIYRVDINGQN
ncbi:kinase-like domain-containing protein [Aspergillus heterothallicus]